MRLGNVFISLLALFMQYIVWAPLFTNSLPIETGPQAFADIFIIILLNVWLVIYQYKISRGFAIIAALFLNTFALLIGGFSFLYWSYGSTVNFNISLTRLDAIYFTFGTLTTAGTGNITAISEASRYIQTLQMFLDLGLMVFAVGLLVTRFTSSLE